MNEFMLRSLPVRLVQVLWRGFLSPLLLLAFYIFTSTAHAQVLQQQLNNKDVITDPRIGQRCDDLLNDRQKKIQNKHKIQSLLRTVKKLQQRTPSEKVSMLRKLYFINERLDQELKITLIEIQAMEENIIRKGCPGIAL